MNETRDTRRHAGPAVLDIGGDIGALLIHTRADLLGREIEVSPRANPAQRIHTAVLARQVPGRVVYAALFLALPAGDYRLLTDDPDAPQTVTVPGGAVAEVDWRASTAPASQLAPARHTHVPPEMLPPRYRTGQPVCATPMGSAPLRYTVDGRVAWDALWTDFCDLALAGGPPHRGTLLVAPDPAACAATPEDSARVVREIARGLRLVAGLAARAGDVPGWVDVTCTDEAMAAWLALAIAAEQVAVRRAGAVLSLPAGPEFRLEYEIKNVVTVVAKTHHYWTEHRAAAEIMQPPGAD